MDNKKPLVAIIIPAYNVSKYIHRAILSSIKQTFTQIEIIIIDDGSNDNTWQIIQDYAKKDSRIIAIKQNNCGVSSARNKAITIARSEYCVFLDADDWINSDTLEFLVDKVKSREKNALVSVDKRFVEENSLDETLNDISKSKETLEKISPQKLLHYFGNPKYSLKSACFKLFKLEIIKTNKIKFRENISHGEDGLFVFEYLHYISNFYYFNNIKWNILKRRDSASRSVFNPKFLTAIDAANLMLYDKRNTQEIKQYLLNYCIKNALDLIIYAFLSDKETKSDYIFVHHNIKSYLSQIRFFKINKKLLIKSLLFLFFPQTLKFIFKIRHSFSLGAKNGKSENTFN